MCLIELYQGTSGSFPWGVAACSLIVLSFCNQECTLRNAARAATVSSSDSQPRFDLDEAIERIAHWLPEQSPIKDFIHHNTLNALLGRPFHEAVAIASRMFGANSYLPIKSYQERYRKGRITDQALDWALERVEPDSSQHSVLRKMLFDEDHTAHYPPSSLPHHGVRQKWLTHIEVNLNALSQPVLFRFAANFLDQGISRWTVAREDESFWACLCRLADNSFIPLYPLDEPLTRRLTQGSTEEAIAACLERIVGSEALYEQYLLEMLLMHPGWSGMVRVIENRPQSLVIPRSVTLKEWIAAELMLELAFLRKKRGDTWAPVVRVPGIDRTVRVADILTRPSVTLPLRIWHEAMEYTLHADLLRALAKTDQVAGSPALPKVQALFCLDDRECSLRRHLEEVDPAIKTYGAAGFFGIDFLFQGVNDAYAVAQCPAAISPKHLIVEQSDAPLPVSGRISGKTGLLQRKHSLMRDWLYTQVAGVGYGFRLALDVFRPGSRLPGIRQLGEIEAHTNLHLLRESDDLSEEGSLLGFSHVEMADRIERLLRSIGLTHEFAPWVVVAAHGSSSVNNPHFAAYDCGACSGKPGAPNARAFAWMANDRTVRSILRERGIDVPDATRFLAAMHNTSRDEIRYYDERLNDDHAPGILEAFKSSMEIALERNAHERCRWFELGPQGDHAGLAHEHVRTRAASIFEPRPELNHSNNLYCLIGRRELTRSLFMDRRAFLHSYDPFTDHSGDMLCGILKAVIPVCGGINLEYLFSRVDNMVFGAGTKLPHNVIGLLGVANGVEGDLRTGLPQQMIEVHEPARLLIVVDQSPRFLDTCLAQLGPLREWIDNEWVRLAVRDPETGEVSLYDGQRWQSYVMDGLPLPVAASSRDAYQGKTETIPVHRLQGG